MARDFENVAAGTLCTEQDGCPASFHSITCIETAKTQPHTLINDDGDVFYPDDVEDADYFIENHGCWWMSGKPPDWYPS